MAVFQQSQIYVSTIPVIEICNAIALLSTRECLLFQYFNFEYWPRLSTSDHIRPDKKYTFVEFTNKRNVMLVIGHAGYIWMKKISKYTRTQIQNRMVNMTTTMKFILHRPQDVFMISELSSNDQHNWNTARKPCSTNCGARSTRSRKCTSSLSHVS